MEKFDLENFPTSESAKKMLSYVSDGFYDESYVGKWIYQVMGIEYDAALKIVEDLPEQFFPETATWGLMFHEIKWGLPIRENLSYEERRWLIFQKRNCRAPMTPYRMEQYLSNITDFEVHISDANDPGIYNYAAPHPNIFTAYFIGEGTLDSKSVHEALNRLKQSHTMYVINDRTEIELDNRNLEEIILRRILFRISAPFWDCRVFDGTWLLDGSVILNAKRRYGLLLGIKYKQGGSVTQNQNSLKLVKITAKLNNDKSISAGLVYCFGIIFWNIHCFDGTWSLDGSVLLDAYRCKMKAALKINVKIDLSKIEATGNLTIETKTKDYWFFDGAYLLDGTKKFDSIYRKEAIG